MFWGADFAQETALSRKSYLLKTFQEAHDWIQDDRVLHEKYKKLMASPFAFLRGTAFLYYLDLKSPSGSISGSWGSFQIPEIWIQGDFHLQNIGFQEVKDEIFLDLNDFDEACIGPFHWDLLRGLVSSIFFLESLSFSISEKAKRDFLVSFLDVYRKTLKHKPTALKLKRLRGSLRLEGDKLKKKRSVKKLLKKWTQKTGSLGREFRTDLPKLQSLSSKKAEEVFRSFGEYRSVVEAKDGLEPEYFVIKGLVRKVGAGLGSLGVDRYLILIEGSSARASDDVILQIKEQRDPSSWIFPSKGHSKVGVETPAERVVDAMKNLLPLVDPLTGTISIKGKPHLVTRISPYEKGWDPTDFETQEEVLEFMDMSAVVLAQAHLRGAKKSLLGRGFSKKAAKLLSQGSAFRQVLMQSTFQYVEQVRWDRSLLAELMSEKELP
jgi:uncharacterized protein (DUF2252 family)